MKGNLLQKPVVLGGVYTALFVVALWDLKWGFGMWFVMNNREASFECNFLWLYTGPLAILPLLILSLISKRIGSACLVLTSILFAYVSLRYYPFGYGTPDILQNLVEVCGPMLVMAAVQFVRLRQLRRPTAAPAPTS